MENATKALLIAGAVLIVILIIGVAMMIYSSTTGTVTQGVREVSSKETEIFNAKFQQYDGTITLSQTKSLLSDIISSNNANTEHPVEVVKTGHNPVSSAKTSAEIANVRKSLKNTNYKISFDYDGAYISKVTIAD